MMSQVHDRVAGLIEGPLDEMGYELVRVMLSGSARPILQVMAERKDGAAMTVDDCAGISRTVSVLLDTEDPIAGAYALEVSSPGIDRPLVRRRDFERYAGFEARIECSEPVAGRRRFRGRLLGMEGDMVRLDLPEGPAELPFERISKAKLVLTDELIAAMSGPQG